MGVKPTDITGQKFNRLTAIERQTRPPYWTCKCDCGNTAFVQWSDLKTGHTKSCGCLNSELSAARKTKHGMHGTPEHRAWKSAKGRCFSSSNRRWMDYGGRGITMCSEWRDDFQAFFDHVGPSPSPGHTLDRIDVDGHYEPGNVRWATHIDQANNKRVNRLITWRGETKTLTQWARDIGMSAATLWLRIDRYKWSMERATTEPLHAHRSDSRPLSDVHTDRIHV